MPFATACRLPRRVCRQHGAARRIGVDADFDASRAWQTLMRWLRYVLPARHERVPARHSEVLRRAAAS